MNKASEMPVEMHSPTSLKGRVTPVSFEKQSTDELTIPKTPKKKSKKEKKKKKKPRCSFKGCKKKLNLSQQTIKCRCQLTFCSEHFPVEEHNCTFDYKDFSKENFEKCAGLGGGKFAKIETI